MGTLNVYGLKILQERRKIKVVTHLLAKLDRDENILKNQTENSFVIYFYYGPVDKKNILIQKP